MTQPRWKRTVRRIRIGVQVILVVYLAAGFVSERFELVQEVVAHRAAEPLAAGPERVLRGVTSVHTEQSHDAVGTVEDVIKAARSAELDFVLLGNHPPEPPQWVPAILRDSILIAFGQEIRADSIGRTHLLGMNRPFISEDGRGGTAKYWSRVAESGATAVIVHARSPNTRDRWRTDASHVHGMEVLDVSEVARRAGKSPWALYHIVTILAYGLVGRVEEGLLRMDWVWFDGPTVAAYDSMAATAPITAMAGLNHHPKITVAGRPLPPYGPFFKTLITRIPLPTTPSPVANIALSEIDDAIREGRVFITLGRAEEADAFRFGAVSQAGALTNMGGTATIEPGLRLATTNVEPGRGSLLIRVMRNGKQIGAYRGNALDLPIDEPGVYRVEIYRYGWRIGGLYWNLRPWIFANPVWIEAQPAAIPEQAGADGSNPLAVD